MLWNAALEVNKKCRQERKSTQTSPKNVASAANSPTKNVFCRGFRAFFGLLCRSKTCGGICVQLEYDESDETGGSGAVEPRIPPQKIPDLRPSGADSPSPLLAHPAAAAKRPGRPEKALRRPGVFFFFGPHAALGSFSRGWQGWGCSERCADLHTLFLFARV